MSSSLLMTVAVVCQFYSTNTTDLPSCSDPDFYASSDSAYEVHSMHPSKKKESEAQFPNREKANAYVKELHGNGCYTIIKVPFCTWGDKK